MQGDSGVRPPFPPFSYGFEIVGSPVLPAETDITAGILDVAGPGRQDMTASLGVFLGGISIPAPGSGTWPVSPRSDGIPTTTATTCSQRHDRADVASPPPTRYEPAPCRS